jgi:hypothetical protein
MLLVVAMMGVSGTVFASDPQVIPKGNSTDKLAISSIEKTPLLKMKDERDHSTLNNKKLLKKKHHKKSDRFLPF